MLHKILRKREREREKKRDDGKGEIGMEREAL